MVLCHWDAWELIGSERVGQGRRGLGLDGDSGGLARVRCEIRTSEKSDFTIAGMGCMPAGPPIVCPPVGY